MTEACVLRNGLQPQIKIKQSTKNSTRTLRTCANNGFKEPPGHTLASKNHIYCFTLARSKPRRDARHARVHQSHFTWHCCCSAKSCTEKLVGAPEGAVNLPIAAVHVATSAVQLPVPSAGIASMIPPSGRGNNPSRKDLLESCRCVEFKKNLIETSKGAVHYAAVALDIAASLTQNLPYIGAISKVLVEISKFVDEVEAFKSSWKVVIAKIQAIQTIIDDFCKCYNWEGRCLVNVIVTMYKCKLTSRIQLIRKSSKLVAEVAQCDRAVDSALSILQAKLQLSQWKDIRDIRNAVMDHPSSLTFDYSSAAILPPAPAIFFGRDKEVDRVVDLIVNDEPASVAIVGTGGIGKTSIALASIHHSKVQEHFQTQQFFLSCEATSTSDSLVQALLKLFGLSVDANSSTSPSDTLTILKHLGIDKDQVELLLVKIVAVRHLTLVITSRDSDHPRGIKWSELKPIQPLAIEAAIETWDAISHSHDDFSILLIQAVECIPLAVTLLAQLAQADSSKALWASWKSESTKFIRSDGSESRLNSLDLSIQLSIQSPRLCACSGAIDFFGVLCMLPQGMPYQCLKQPLE
ncbi:P-loop containing nucleoside triphosphate hydrolase protein [Mycena pura]|uniref:P-loop containing nucleoside triphosphate hydrolase protein n=1 Tax=Mycena pura TaxID=153505 RepID=A0AAD6Y8I8_9AGAR|nr:P-loop containing nucleoside triphosphate hydrolase protein [Mycena pura]